MPYSAPASERFWSKVDKSGSCWLWTGSTCGTSRKYGNFYVGGGRANPVYVYAHRFAYELVNGPVPDGLTLDHVAERGCTSQLCVNPDHLEVVTQAENIRRWFRARTKCRRGHRYAETGWTEPKSGRRRECAVCFSERRRHASAHAC